MKESLKKILTPSRVVIALSFMLWIFLFREFLFNKRILQSDAIAYFEHFEFFIKNISRGVYPLWEPSRINGIPTEFFLRRIGSFNPLYLLMALVHKCGVPFLYTYLWFLAGYYFLGAVGFYVLAKKVLRDQSAALLAFLLLFFSSLGTRIFDSYFILTFIPLVWFFYFLISFFQRPTRGYWLGVVFTIMLIFTTYLPFYFLLIAGSFVLFFSIFYFHLLPELTCRLVRFIGANRLLVALSCVVMVMSLAPGVLFYLDGKQGELILPMRGGVSAEEGHIMEVSKEMVTSWGIVEDILFSLYFQDVRLMRFAVLYIPITAWILLVLGGFVQVNRRLVFLGIWMAGFYLTISTYGPVYQFLSDRIFFYKYFRNIHFFLWFLLLPLFILFVAECFKLFWEQLNGERGWIRKKLILVVVVHVVFLVWGLTANPAGWISSAAIVVSGAFWFWAAMLGEKRKFLKPVFILAVVCITGLQSAEVYFYLIRNSDKNTKPFPYRYDNKTPYFQFPIIKEEQRQRNLQLAAQPQAYAGSRSNSAYIAMVWNKFLREHLPPMLFDYYAGAKFIAYDKVLLVDKKNFEFDAVKETFTQYNNQAFVFAEPGQAIDIGGTDPSVSAAEIISLESGAIKPGKYTVNEIVMETNFSGKKFLVFTENYHAAWRAFIDGKRVPLWQANVAFKGVVVPEGRHTLVFKFGEPWRVFLNYALLALFNGVFIALVICLVCDRRVHMMEIA